MDSVLLYDANRNPLAVANGVAIPASTQGLLLLGSDGTNSRYLKVDATGAPAVAQSVLAAPSNNSTTPLAANGVFTGTGESTLNIAGIQINIFSNVASAPRGVQVQQSNDNTNWDIVDTFTVHGGTGFSTTIQATASFFRIIYTNGPTVQASFRLAVALCPMVEAMPRALSETTRTLKIERKASDITVLDTSTITAAGSFVVTSYGERAANLIVNVLNSPTGTTPTLTFTLAEVDPINQTTVVGQSTSGAAITAIGTQIIQLITHKSSCIKVSWAVTGTTPSFTGVNATITEKVVPNLRVANSAQSTVASSASSVTILAANNDRDGSTIFNDSNSNLFVKLGATASATSFTVRMVPNAYYETPFGYIGIIDGIWATANGSARVTEFT